MPLYASFNAVPAHQFTFADLAEIYNRARADYIVPMPMNAHRLEEYVRFYDVRLDASAVICLEGGVPAAVGMLGLRGDRAWVTRLGVLPEYRGRGIGRFLMETLLGSAKFHGARHAQLEVIEGNKPAHELFKGFDFTETRKLVVLRRPPTAVTAEPVEFEVMSRDDISQTLCTRIETSAATCASWLDENATFQNLSGLGGYRLISPEYNRAWVVFRNAAFQLTHIVVSADDPQHALTLLRLLHSQHKPLDTKLENLPATSPYTPAFQQLGYRLEFTRVEMARQI